VCARFFGCCFGFPFFLFLILALPLANAVGCGQQSNPIANAFHLWTFLFHPSCSKAIKRLHPIFTNTCGPPKAMPESRKKMKVICCLGIGFFSMLIAAEAAAAALVTKCHPHPTPSNPDDEITRRAENEKFEICFNFWEIELNCLGAWIRSVARTVTATTNQRN
jgi:hypothetical protein